LADPADFLARWSRLKRKAQAEPRSAGARSGTAQPRTAEADPQAPTHTAPAAAEPIEELPPIETLGKDSDYTPFMRADVPDALRNEALRKLWQSDPVFANLDGLVDYAEDFGAAFKLGGVVATVYRVLEGMPGPVEEDRAEKPEATADAAAGSGDRAHPEPEVAEAAPASQAREQNEDIELG
jgi:Protein of unknown function (DUF3306)